MAEFLYNAHLAISQHYINIDKCTAYTWMQYMLWWMYLLVVIKSGATRWCVGTVAQAWPASAACWYLHSWWYTYSHVCAYNIRCTCLCHCNALVLDRCMCSNAVSVADECGVLRRTSWRYTSECIQTQYLSVPLQCGGARWLCEWCGAGVAGACGVCGVLRHPPSSGASPLAPSSFNLRKQYSISSTNLQFNIWTRLKMSRGCLIGRHIDSHTVSSGAHFARYALSAR